MIRTGLVTTNALGYKKRTPMFDPHATTYERVDPDGIQLHGRSAQKPLTDYKPTMPVVHPYIQRPVEFGDLFKPRPEDKNIIVQNIINGQVLGGQGLQPTPALTTIPPPMAPVPQPQEPFSGVTKEEVTNIVRESVSQLSGELVKGRQDWGEVNTIITDLAKQVQVSREQAVEEARKTKKELEEKMLAVVTSDAMEVDDQTMETINQQLLNLQQNQIDFAHFNAQQLNNIHAANYVIGQLLAQQPVPTVINQTANIWNTWVQNNNYSQTNMYNYQHTNNAAFVYAGTLQEPISVPTVNEPLEEIEARVPVKQDATVPPKLLGAYTAEPVVTLPPEQIEGPSRKRKRARMGQKVLPPTRENRLLESARKAANRPEQRRAALKSIETTQKMIEGALKSPE